MINGIGATPELSLRVSVATLVRVLVKLPGNGESILVLERNATLYPSESGGVINVKSQPFGGAIRILDVNRMYDLIGDFHFDSERSVAEQDFRIFIKASSWITVRNLCLQQFNSADNFVLETDPVRELTEEFEDALNVNLNPTQYWFKPVRTIVEDNPSTTQNIYAPGFPTVRIYRVFEVSIVDTFLIDTMIKNSQSFSNQALREIALEDARRGGKGRANAILVLPVKNLMGAYLALSPHERNAPILFWENQLDETVTALLDDITAPKYQRI